jgi:hypothetical protein
VSIESVNEDLVRLKRDIRSLSKDAGRLLGDVAGQGRTIEEEAVAAEFIVAEETMENVGSALEALSQLGDIQRQQVRMFFTDQLATAQAIIQVRSPADLLRIGFEHWGRRATHLTEGFSQTVDVLANEARALTNTLVEVWNPFIELLRQDWARR